ncbi:MAG: hypothetical protein R3C61_23000 [Bacteroidia bacterium]
MALILRLRLFLPTEVRGNTTKDTLANVKATGEAVINIVNYGIVHQMAHWVWIMRRR